MNQQEEDLLKKYAADNPELKELWEEHILFEKKLSKLTSKAYLSPQEQMEVAQLKKQKLEGKTRMVAMLDKLRAENA